MKKILIHIRFKYIIVDLLIGVFKESIIEKKMVVLKKKLKLALNLTLGQYTMNSGNPKLTSEHSKTHH